MDIPKIIPQGRSMMEDIFMPMESKSSSNLSFSTSNDDSRLCSHNERHGHICTTPSTPMSAVPSTLSASPSFDETMESFAQFSPPPLNQSATTTPSHPSRFVSNDVQIRYPELRAEIDVSDDTMLMIPMLNHHNHNMDDYERDHHILLTPPTNQSYYVTFPSINTHTHSRPILRRRTTSRSHHYGDEKDLDVFRSAVHDPTEDAVPRSIDFRDVPNLDSLSDDDNNDDDMHYENQQLMYLSLSLPKEKHRPLPRFPLLPRQSSRNYLKYP